MVFFPLQIAQKLSTKISHFNENRNKVIPGNLPNHVTLCLKALGIES